MIPRWLPQFQPSHPAGEGIQERSPLYGYVFLRVRELSLESAKQLFCYSLTDQNYITYLFLVGLQQRAQENPNWLTWTPPNSTEF